MTEVDCKGPDSALKGTLSAWPVDPAFRPCLDLESALGILMVNRRGNTELGTGPDEGNHKEVH